jgi:hypothetical protein
MQLKLFFSKAPSPPSPLEAKLKSVLQGRIPAAAINHVVDVFLEFPLGLHITRDRTSKLGDYRPARLNQSSRITVNGTLNLYAFLITLVHEIAHHHVHIEYSRSLKAFSFRRKRKPLPHGTEWKEKFRQLIAPMLNTAVFPPELLPVMTDYFQNPKASSAADHELTRALKQYDPPDSTVRLEDLPYDALFTLHGRRFFRKKEKLRSRYRCICLKSNRTYLVSAAAPVTEIPATSLNK